MTTVYFVRHALPDLSNHDDMTRALTSKGLEDSRLVTAFLADKSVTALYSSPFRRAVQTVEAFAAHLGLTIMTVDGFRERQAAQGWINDFHAFVQAQWADFDYCLPGGESLREVERRNIAALEDVLRAHPNQAIAIGSHGTALSTIIHHYQPDFGCEDFQRIKGLMPWVVRLCFDGLICREIVSFDLFGNTQHSLFSR